jgi:hypothetical protein
MVRLSKVFVAGGFPSITYISRNEYQLESKIKDYLEEEGKLLSIFGSTKSGKTVLVHKIVPEESCFMVQGGQVTDLDSFWQIVLEQTGGYTALSETTSKNKSSTSGREAKASAKLAGIGGDITSQISENDEYGTNQTLSRIAPSTSSAIKQLLHHMLPLVVDDFHYIDQSVQKLIIRSLKSPIFKGLPVILITIPHRAYDIIRGEKEMTGRVKELEIPAWQTSELEKIAELGFRELKVSCSPEIIKKMAEESFDSPHLMQDFCLALCKLNGISETQSSVIQLQEPDDWQSFFRNIDSNTSKLAFESLAKGPPNSNRRISRILVNGETCDIYGAVLFAIAYTGPKTTLSYEDIRKGLQKVLSSEIPDYHEITRVLRIMSEIAKKFGGEPVVDWDNSSLHISDPFFAYYLRWGIDVPEEE